MMHPSPERARRTMQGTADSQSLGQSWFKHLRSHSWAHDERDSGDWEEPARIFKCKSCQDNLIASCDELTSSVDEGKAEAVFCLEFSKASSVILHRILTPTSGCCSLDGQNPDQGVVQMGSYSGSWLQTEFLGGLSSLISLSVTGSKRQDAVLSGCGLMILNGGHKLVCSRPGLLLRGIHTC